MRQIFFDTETTGLKPEEGHRILEVAAVAYKDRRRDGEEFHYLVNPEREVDEDAARIHGFRWPDLEDKPRFADVAEKLTEYLRGGELIIHNAPFDVAFLNAEFKRLGMPPTEKLCAKITCTLVMAKRAFRAGPKSLDWLCDKFEIDRSGRERHSALLDTRLLAEVYLAMTRGQRGLDMADAPGREDEGEEERADLRGESPARIIAAGEEELAAHRALMKALAKQRGEEMIWRD